MIPKTTMIKLLKEGSEGGKFTKESITQTSTIIEELIKNISKSSKEIADAAGKKLVTEKEITIAAKYFIKAN